MMPCGLVEIYQRLEEPALSTILDDVTSPEGCCSLPSPWEPQISHNKNLVTMETSDNALLSDEEYCFRCQLQVNESGRAALGPGVSIRTGGAKSDFLYLCIVV